MKKYPTEAEQVSSVAERFDKQYFDKMDLILYDGSTPAQISKKLHGLTSTSTARDVEEIVGNKSWIVEPRACTECGEATYKLVVLGDDEDDVLLCKSCLEKALRMLS